MKWLKIFLSIVVLLVVIGALAIIVLVNVIDPNKLKPVITEEVLKQTGYKLSIDGKMSWAFYPRLSLKMERMTLSAPGESNPFVDLHDIRVGAALSQLLHGVQRLNGDIYIADVNLMNIHAQHAQVNLDWQNQALTLNNLTALLYDGTLRANAHGEHFAGDPAWSWDAQFAGVQLQPLLKDVNPQAKLVVSGIANLTTHLSTQGKSKEQVLQNLNGTAEISVHDGVVEGMDINFLIQAADSLLNKQALPASDGKNTTEFKSLFADFTVKNGTITTNNLLLTSLAFTTKGAGDVNLVDQTINMSLAVNPAQALKTQWEIPVIVSGTLDQPDVKLDMSAVESFLSQQQLGKVKDKARDEIKKHIPGKAGDYLQKLLGN